VVTYVHTYRVPEALMRCKHTGPSAHTGCTDGHQTSLTHTQESVLVPGWPQLVWPSTSSVLIPLHTR
jgi:hypothetical protein